MKPEDWKSTEVKADKVETKDLMLGDLVVLDYDECTQLVVRIIGIYEDSVDVDIPWSKSECEHWEDMHRVHPIRVTKDLLEQIGFEHDNDEDLMIDVVEEFNDKELCFLISKDRRVTINNVDLNSFNEWYVHIDSEDMRTILSGEFTFLHELQHLYKLGHIEGDIIMNYNKAKDFAVVHLNRIC